MKKALIIFVLILASGTFIVCRHQPSTRTGKALADTQSVPTAHVAETSEHVAAVPASNGSQKTFRELKEEYLALTSEQVLARILDIEQTIEHYDLIARANAGTLSEAEQSELSQNLRKLSALHAAKVAKLIARNHAS